MHPLVASIRRRLKEEADATRARQMQAYMKSTMPCRGVPAPVQRTIVASAIRACPLADADTWRSAALSLWRGASYREERYAAIMVTGARPYSSFNTFAAMPMHEEMIVTGAWWDFVDTIASHQVGDILAREPRRMKPLMRRWARDSNLWKRRTAILCQIRFKQKTDLELLFDCIAANRDDRDFFIRKAIGWALRSYAWTDPRAVRRYVSAHRDTLSPLSVREALKNIAV